MEMSRKEWLKVFREFLMNNYVLEQYVTQSTKTHINNPECFISMAFDWSRSDEGFDFWDELDDIWLDICKNLRFKNKEENVRSN